MFCAFETWVKNYDIAKKLQMCYFIKNNTMETLPNSYVTHAISHQHSPTAAS